MQTQVHQQAINQLQHVLTQVNEHNIVKAKLLSMFSHDFANSLTSILMIGSLLRNHIEQMDANRRQTQLTRIESSVHLLLHMLDDLFVITQIETGAYTPQPGLVPVHNFFQRLQNDCQVIYGERCHLQLESPNREITGIDGRLLHLIAINLITYAIKTSPKGNTIVFTLEGKATECTVAVRDSDTSMPAAERRRFFHVLQQPSTVETVAILGLDLAIVKEVVTFQGGSIQYDDQGEAGTAVTIIMPTLELTNEVSRSKIIGLDGQPLQPKQA